MRRSSTAAALSLLIGCLGGVGLAADAPAWGTIKGQVVFEGDLPKPRQIKIPAGRAAGGRQKVEDETWVVNPRNRGVRWALVWLMRKPGIRAREFPIHPALKVPPARPATLDMSGGQFNPHLLALREGQDLVIQNTSKVQHLPHWAGFANEGGTVLLASGQNHSIKGLQAERLPMSVQCDIDTWMSARVAVFAHPYFAVTDADGKFEIKDAPVGTWGLVVWHETGFAGGIRGRNGRPVTVKAKGVTDMGKISLRDPTVDDGSASARLAKGKTAPIEWNGPIPAQTEEAVPLLLAVLHSDQERSRQRAARALDRMAADAGRAGGPLRQALADPDLFVRGWAAVTLAQTGDLRPVLPALQQTLANPDAELRNRAVEVLSQYRGEARLMLPVWQAALKSQDPLVRQTAAQAVGRFGEKAKELVPPLVQLLGDSEPLVRGRAAQALVQIGPAAVPALGQAVANKNLERRRAAVYALGRLGPAARSVLPALQEASKDKDTLLRLAATTAIRRIEVPPRKE